jgi:dihydrofolate reductase
LESWEEATVAKLIYSAIMSIDGYIADESGNFDWAMPDAEVHTFANELERRIGTYLHGRRMYEVMSFWEDEAALASEPDYVREFGSLWRAAEKIVYSQSLAAIKTGRTRLERQFKPEHIQQLKTTARQDLSIAGPTLAAHAFKSGLVDECHFLVAPASVGAGLPALPIDFRVRLELMDQRSFSSGVAHLHYLVKPWE